MPVMKRKALPKTAENQWTPGYEIYRDGVLVGTAHCTGRPGVDNYPWDWALKVPARELEIGFRKQSRTQGNGDTLGSCIEQIEQWAA